MPIAKKATISQDFLEQIKNNTTKATAQALSEIQNSTVSTANPQFTEISQTAPVDSESTGKKEKYADVMNIRLSKGRRNEIKTFCSSCGISVTQYIESSFEYLAEEVAAGRIVISKGGIKKGG